MKAIDKFIRKLTKAAMLAHPHVETKHEAESLFNAPQTKFEDPSKNEVMKSLLSDRVSIFNKLWYIIHVIKANNIENDDKAFKKLLDYLNECKHLIEYKTGTQIHLKVDEELSNQGFKLTKIKREKVHAYIQNIIFIKINENPLKFEPNLVTSVREWLRKILDGKRIKYESLLVVLKPEELDVTTKFTLTIGQKQVPMFMNKEILALVKEHHSAHEPFIAYVNNLTTWGEDKSRKEYSKLLLELSEEMKSTLFNGKMAMQKLYNLLYAETISPKGRRNKQRVYNFFHTILRPFYSSLHSKEEHDAIRLQSAHDKRTYKQHIRDSVESLIE
jgi:hypothetical protein